MRRTTGLLLLLLCSASSLTAQAPVIIARPDSSPPRHVFLEGRVEVPLVGDTPTGLPIVEVRINGKGPFRFGIETGARLIALTPELAATLGLVRTGGPDNYPTFRVDSLSIGSARFHDMPVMGLRTAAADIQGILGLPLYQSLLLTIDYPNRRAIFERGALPQPNGRDVFPMTRVGDFWGFGLSVGDQQFTAILDTRSTGAFGFTPTDTSRLKFATPLVVIGRARGAAIAETEVLGGKLAGDIAIGTYRFPTPFVSIRPLPPGFPTQPIVGNVVLRNFQLTLDQQNARLRLSRSGPDVIELPEPARRPPPASGASPGSPSGASTSSSVDATGTSVNSRSTSNAATGNDAFVGTYGERVVTLSAGKLYLRRNDGPLLEMRTTGKDTFGLVNVPEAAIEFVRDAGGRVIEMRVRAPNGVWESAKVRTETRANRKRFAVAGYG